MILITGILSIFAISGLHAGVPIRSAEDLGQLSALSKHATLKVSLRSAIEARLEGVAGGYKGDLQVLKETREMYRANSAHPQAFIPSFYDAMAAQRYARDESHVRVMVEIYAEKIHETLRTVLPHSGRPYQTPAPPVGEDAVNPLQRALDIELVAHLAILQSNSESDSEGTQPDWIWQESEGKARESARTRKALAVWIPSLSIIGALVGASLHAAPHELVQTILSTGGIGAFTGLALAYLTDPFGTKKKNAARVEAELKTKQAARRDRLLNNFIDALETAFGVALPAQTREAVLGGDTSALSAHFCSNALAGGNVRVAADEQEQLTRHDEGDLLENEENTPLKKKQQ